MEKNVLTEKIIGAAIEVHRTLGPGLLESAYQECLQFELKSNGLYVEKEKALPIVYKDIKLDHGYRIDLLVENKIVLELVCTPIRKAFQLVKNENKYDVQIFGDRINIVLDNNSNSIEDIEILLKQNSITISSKRIIPPTLENVFIYKIKEAS